MTPLGGTISSSWTLNLFLFGILNVTEQFLDTLVHDPLIEHLRLEEFSDVNLMRPRPCGGGGGADGEEGPSPTPKATHS